jgi:Zn-dependent M32 family carboxypeptidase
MTYRAPELVRHVTGEPPNPDYLVRYLEAKYAEIHRF